MSPRGRSDYACGMGDEIIIEQGNIDMRNMVLGTLVVACVAVCGRIVGAAEAATIVDEKVILSLSDDVYRRGKAGFRSMRLRPGGRMLLYARRRSGDDRKPYYQLILRDIKAGEDTVLKIPGYDYAELVGITLSGKVFDPAGMRLALGVGIDANTNGRHDLRGKPPEKMQAVVYDLFTDKTTKVGPTAMLVMASFDRTGKGLVLAAMDRPGRDCRMYATPVDKITLRQFGLRGIPRGICPAADVMAVRQLPGSVVDKTGKRLGHRIGLLDLVKGKMVADLPLREGNNIDDYGPQWTPSGRHFYYVGRDREPDKHAGTRSKYESRIWDRVKGQPAPELFPAAEYAGGWDDVSMKLVKGADRVEVRLYYQTTSREYVEFLRDEINGTGGTLPGLGAGGDPAYLIQTDSWFSQLAAWGDTLWDLWVHNRDVHGAAPVLMAEAAWTGVPVPALAPPGVAALVLCLLGTALAVLVWRIKP